MTTEPYYKGTCENPYEIKIGSAIVAENPLLDNHWHVSGQDYNYSAPPYVELSFKRAVELAVVIDHYNTTKEKKRAKLPQEFLARCNEDIETSFRLSRKEVNPADFNIIFK